MFSLASFEEISSIAYPTGDSFVSYIPYVHNIPNVYKFCKIENLYGVLDNSKFQFTKKSRKEYTNWQLFFLGMVQRSVSMQTTLLLLLSLFFSFSLQAVDTPDNTP